MKEADLKKIIQNLNRFAFDGKIKDLNQDSLVEYLMTNQKLSLYEAIELCNENWEEGNAENTMVFIIAHDYEGKIVLINENIQKRKIRLDSSINYLVLDKLTKKVDTQKSLTYNLLVHYSNENFNDALWNVEQLLSGKQPLSRELNFKLFCINAKILMKLDKFQESFHIIKLAEIMYNTRFSDNEKDSLNDKINNINKNIIFWDCGVLNYDYFKLQELKKEISSLIVDKIKK